MRGFIQLFVLFIVTHRISSQDIYRGRLSGATLGGRTSAFGPLSGTSGLFSQGGVRSTSGSSLLSQFNPRFGSSGGSWGLTSMTGARFGTTGGSDSLFSRAGSQLGSPSERLGLFTPSDSRVGSPSDGGGLVPSSVQSGTLSFGQPSTFGSSRFISPSASGAQFDWAGRRLGGGFQPSRRRTIGVPSLGRRSGLGGRTVGISGIGARRSDISGLGGPASSISGLVGPVSSISGLGGPGGSISGTRDSIGGSIGGPDPDDIRRILGSSILGRELRMGERGLPRHGGAGIGEEHANGMMRGWDGNPQTLGNRFENEWNEMQPSRGAPRRQPGFRGGLGPAPGMRPFG